MKLVESYALSTGLEIDKPSIITEYFPLQFDKWIVLHNSSGMQSKNYDYWQDVVDILLPTLDKNNIKIIQIGDTADHKMSGCIHLLGQTSIKQTAWLIQNAILVIGNDSFSSHMAGALNVPSVTLFGATTVKNHSPYHAHEKSIFIESNRGGKNPSYSPNENPKTINLINPEEIVEAVSKIMGFDVSEKVETLHIGEFYNAMIVEVIPDAIIHEKSFPNSILNIRMDYHFDERMLFENLKRYKCKVFTDKPISIEMLKNVKQNVLIVYDIQEDSSVDFIKGLKSNGIKYELHSLLEGEKLDAKKLDFMDYGVIVKKEVLTEAQLANKDLVNQDTFLKSHKFLLSNGKIYLSKWHFDNQINTDNLKNNITKINYEHRADIFRDQQFHWYFNRTNAGSPSNS